MIEFIKAKKQSKKTRHKRWFLLDIIDKAYIKPYLIVTQYHSREEG